MFKRIHIVKTVNILIKYFHILYSNDFINRSSFSPVIFQINLISLIGYRSSCSFFFRFSSLQDIRQTTKIDNWM